MCFRQHVMSCAVDDSSLVCTAQAEQFSYCQPWMLAWDYRKQNLLKELLNYNADIMCLQVPAPGGAEVLSTLHASTHPKSLLHSARLAL
jgi:hypothetical protein